MASKLDILNRFSLTKKPDTQQGNKDTGIIINIPRRLPADVFKQPRKLSGFNTVKANAKKEFHIGEPKDIVDDIDVDADPGSGFGSGGVGASASDAVAARSDKPTSSAFVVDKRNISGIDRAEIIERMKRSRVVPIKQLVSLPLPLPLPLPSKAHIGSESEEINLVSEIDESPKALKLQKRIVLQSNKPPKQSAASAAIAMSEEKDKDKEFDLELGDLPVAAAAAAPDSSVKEPSQKSRMFKLKKPPSSASISVAATAVKEQLKKLKEKSEPATLTSSYKIGDTILSERIPAKTPLPQIQASEFYMNNRSKFIQYINALFRSYREELTSGESDISCEALYGGDDSASVSLLTHQKIVRDYLNIYSPYRGLLLFHGLGSGKTCSSIAIAEGLKTFKKIVVMTPASLRMNYIEEMKSKCGDLMYKKNQYWEFIESRGNPELTHILSQILMFPDDKFVRANGGAWMVNVTKKSNYETELTPSQRVRVDRQIDEMINVKYEFINYNGLRSEKLKSMTDGYTHNPFDNSVVIIDEAHNFVSRIVNKLKKTTTMAYRLYQFLLSAQNSKVVLLTGTPIINYPNEIAVLFNILRGNIDNWVFTIGGDSTVKPSLDTFKDIFGLSAGTGRVKPRAGAAAAAASNFAKGIGLSFDYMDYNARTKKLIITRNPFGFVRDYDPVSSKYRGVVRRGKPDAVVGEDSAASDAKDSLSLTKFTDVTSTENGLLSDAAFERVIIQKLRENGISVVSASTNKQTPYTALPDKLDDFNSLFIDPATLQLKNRDLFIRRILGLTSYFRSAQEKLLPTYDSASNFHLVEVEMSDYQFAIYSRVRDMERNQESQMKKNAKKRGTGKGKKGNAGGGGGGGVGDLYDDVSTTYRIFSRAFCNFVFPASIRRPLPNDKESALSELDKKAALGGVPDPSVMGEINETAESIAARIGKVITNGLVVPGRKGKGKAVAASAANDSDLNPENALHEDMVDGVESVDDDDIIITGESVVSAGAVASSGMDAAAVAAPEAEGRSSKKAYVAQYQAAIVKAMRDLEVSAGSYLTPEELVTYSPKFLHMLQNIITKEHVGLHLVYSQFRTLEGIGILKLILETNGFSQFKIKQSSLGDWTIDMKPEEQERPCFALYTGTETPEEKEIIRNIFNSKWKNVPKTITDQLSTRFTNNMFGEVIKVLMITASGAEGINLRNVRYVHIAEPYWHPVRTEQIIGRARRICSHIDLPEELRTVDVFLYVMRFSGRQMAVENDESLNIRMNDKSKTDNVTPMSTDQSLYEISNIKERITKQILTAVKESSFDCMIHANPDSKERLNCYSFGADVNEDSLAYKPDIALEEDDKTSKLNKTVKTIALRKLVVNGKEYAEDRDTHILYDIELYKMGNMVERGRRIIIPADPKSGEGEKSRFDWL
jgi:hypothetical protein